MATNQASKQRDALDDLSASKDTKKEETQRGSPDEEA
jgi:hypothetical protein